VSGSASAPESGIEVAVDARYVEGESDPVRNRYVFAYTITISNLGSEPGQLLDRHWFIADGDNEVREVQGPGVVGEQPRLEPGTAFRYTSAAVLETPVGTMHGLYGFRRDDGTRFEVPIPMFSLAAPNAVH
jgi:ApaG protein